MIHDAYNFMVLNIFYYLNLLIYYYFFIFKFIDSSQFSQFTSNYLCMQGDLQPSLSSFAQLDSDTQHNVDDNSSNMK